MSSARWFAFCFLSGFMLFVPPGKVAQTPAPPEATDAMNAQAHTLLERVVRINGLSVEGAPPWHMKADFQWQMTNKPVESGSLEEWWKGPDTWRRTYTMKRGTWTEWSVDRLHRFESPEIFPPFPKLFAELRIATPLITPLFQAKNFLPEYPMQMAPMEAGGHLNCISVVDAVRYVDKTDPDFLFPKYCLDGMGVLRGVVTSNTLVSFTNLTVFDKRAVARTVDVYVDAHLMSESKITLLEDLAPADEAQLEPAANAVPQPFIPTASDPRPVLVHTERPMVPANMVIAGGGGPVIVAVIIQKDGSVRLGGTAEISRYAGLGVIYAAMEAARRWRYQPYAIDGQPVEVAWNIRFNYGRNGYEPAPMGDSDKPTGYDPKRDPATDLKAAEAEAQQEHKHILLEVGGEWCIWCGYMDHFFADHADVDSYLKANYVLVKVNWSTENHNNAFLMQYADINSFPYLIVLDEHGKLLKAEKTGELEKGRSYDPDKMKDFLSKWKPS